MTRRIRDSGQECVAQNEEIRQLQAEIQEKNFADCTSEDGRTVVGKINIRKYRTSLGGGMVDRTDAGKMDMAHGLSTNVMSKNVSRDKEMKENLKAITKALVLRNRDRAHEPNGGESESLGQVQFLSRFHRGIGKTDTSATARSCGEHVSRNGRQRRRYTSGDMGILRACGS
jgi:hypothetical protein